MLGIIIGVGAVIAMVGIGQGASATIQSSIANLGNNMLFVHSGSQNFGGQRGGAGSGNNLTPEDAEAIEMECPAVRAVTPAVRANGQLVFGNLNWVASSQIQGTNEKFPDIRLWPVAIGEFFTEGDVRTSARVCVIGKTVADNLFAGADPVGQTMRIRNLPFRVVGVLSTKGQNQYGQDQDDTVIVPYTAALKKMLSRTDINQVMVSAMSPAATFTAEKQITDLLRQRHKLGANQENDFFVRNLTDVAEIADAAEQDYDQPSRLHCRCISAGRRNRNHEHHARIGNRKNPGDRNKNGYWCAQQSDPASVPDRVRHSFGCRRHLRNSIWRRCFNNHIQDTELAHAGFTGVDRCGCSLFRAGGSVIRLLSGTQGGRPRSDRSAPI